MPPRVRRGGRRAQNFASLVMPPGLEGGRGPQKIVIVTEEGHAEQAHGASIVKKACYAPARQMALNAGSSPDLVIKQILDADVDFGWDFRNDRLTNLIESGIIDPVKVTRTALQNAASAAGTLMTTNYGIIQTENK